MKILLDTHIFLWWEGEASRLSAAAFAACQSAENTLVLSVASLWEIQIKFQLGKLSLSEPIAEKIQRQQNVNGLVLLPVEATHVFTLEKLLPHHRDPFDRLLVAQAIAEQLPIVTQDPLVSQYDVTVIG